MSNFFNRLKPRKTALNTVSSNEGDSTSTCSFDEAGFLCPICHQKFDDPTELASHYTQFHAEPTPQPDENADGKPQDPPQESATRKQKYATSEESRTNSSHELMQEKRRARGLEADLESLQKQLRLAQTRMAEQSETIQRLNGSSTSATSELSNTLDQRTTKGQQPPASSKDEVAIRDRLGNKEKQLESLRLLLVENSQKLQDFDQILSSHEQASSRATSSIQNDINEIKQLIQLTRERKSKLDILNRSTCARLNEHRLELVQSKQTNDQLRQDLKDRIESNEKLAHDLQVEQKQTNSYRYQIETLTSEMQQLEKSLGEFKQEKYQLLQDKINTNPDDEQLSLVRHLTHEKDQSEQANRELRLQIKQTKNDQQQLEDRVDQLSKQVTQLHQEKNQLENDQKQSHQEINLLKQQLNESNREKERQLKKFHDDASTAREQYSRMNIKLENDLQQAKDERDLHKREFDQWKIELTKQIQQLEGDKYQLKQSIYQQERVITDLKIQLQASEKDRILVAQQAQTIEAFQTTLTQLRIQEHQKDTSRHRLATNIHRCVNLAHRVQTHLQKTIEASQVNLLAILDQIKQESSSAGRDALLEISAEFNHSLTVVQQMMTDSKAKLDEERVRLLAQVEKQSNQLKKEHDESMKKYTQQKGQIEQLNAKLQRVSESLTEAQRVADLEREKTISLQDDLQSRSKKHEMQLSALKENLATVRTELRAANEKVAQVEQIKTEKADVEVRLVVSQDERHVLLERSLASEAKNQKLHAENNQQSKKITELDAAITELSLEYQVLQMQSNKINQRRWKRDDDVNDCTKCRQSFSVTQRKHHCRCCGNIFCDNCSAKTAIVAASSKKPQRVCDQCYQDLSP